MTINYTRKVVSVKGFGCLWRLVLRWQGSVYKLIWPDFFVFNLVFFSLSAIYRFYLGPDGKRAFEKVTEKMNNFTSEINIAFVLGFYVTVVLQRWWSQFENIPWPDTLSVFVSSSIWGNDEKGRMYRRNILRYVNFGTILAFSDIAPGIKKKYPTMNRFVELGILTRSEKKIFESIPNKTSQSMYWLPFVWAASLAAKARKEGRILNDMAWQNIVREINKIRGLCGVLLSYDWISIPLVYTQVVTIAVWSYFVATLMGKQFLEGDLDYVLPVFTYLEFLIYVGWLKVAETLVNPFGEDDDDFEIGNIIERNIKVSYMMVDEIHNTTPSMSKDIHWEEKYLSKLALSTTQQMMTADPTKSGLIMDLDNEFFPTVSKENTVNTPSTCELENTEYNHSVPGCPGLVSTHDWSSHGELHRPPDYTDFPLPSRTKQIAAADHPEESDSYESSAYPSPEKELLERFDHYDRERDRLITAIKPAHLEGQTIPPLKM